MQTFVYIFDLKTLMESKLFLGSYTWVSNFCCFTAGWKKNLDKSQCTSTIDSADNAVLSPNFKYVISKIVHWA